MLEVILAVVGATLGAVWAGGEGLFIGAVVGYAGGFTLAMRQRLAAHTVELAALRARLDALSAEKAPLEFDLEFLADSTTPDSATTTGSEPAPAAQTPRQVPVQSSYRAPAEGLANPPSASVESSNAAGSGTFKPASTDDGSVPLPQSPARIAAAASGGASVRADTSDRKRDDLFTRATAAVLNFVRGGNPMVRIGVIVLFFGVSFLAKLAIDADLVSIELRMAGIAAGGLALVALGWNFRRSHADFALPLQGGGMGILFLAVFAAYRLYGLLPAGLCFGLLVGLVGFAAVLAVAQNSAALAAFGVVGGFLAPVLASTGSGDHVALFSYYLVLNLSIMGIAWFKAWRVLNWLGFVFTFVIGSLWGAQYYTPDLFDTTEPFLVAHFLLYTLVAVLFAFRQPPQLRGVVDGTLLFGTPLIAFVLQAQLVEGMDMGLAWSAAAGAAFYIILAGALCRIQSMRLLMEVFVVNGIVLASIAVPLALDARWTSVTWALEGAGVLWVGVRQGRALPRLLGVLLQFLAGASLVEHLHQHPLVDARLVLNAQYLGAVLVSVAGLFCGAYLYRAREQLHRVEAAASWVLGAWGLLWWFGAGVIELYVRVNSEYEWGALLAFLALSSGVSTLLERRVLWPVLRVPTLALVLALTLTAMGMAVFEPHPLVSGAWGGWPLALLIQLALLRVVDGWVHILRKTVHSLSFWLVIGLVAWAVTYWLDERFGARDSWGLIIAGLVPALALGFVSQAAGGSRWPIGANADAYLNVATAPVVALLGLWMWLINTLPPASVWDLVYVPLINPTDVANGVAALAVVHWWRQCRNTLADWPLVKHTTLGLTLFGATLFFWANAVLFRTIHYWFGVQYDFAHLWRSDLTQTTLAVFWPVLGVLGMVLGAKTHRRVLWLAAAILMGVVVLKLFFVDLANTNTLERVISFLSVGILMVVVGFFAPVPPRQRIAQTSMDQPSEPARPPAS